MRRTAPSMSNSSKKTQPKESPAPTDGTKKMKMEADIKFSTQEQIQKVKGEDTIMKHFFVKIAYNVNLDKLQMEVQTTEKKPFFPAVTVSLFPSPRRVRQSSRRLRVQNVHSLFIQSSRVTNRPKSRQM